MISPFDRPIFICAAFASALLTAAALPFSAAAMAQNSGTQMQTESSKTDQRGKITVEASGTASAKPDMASLQISVANRAKTAQEAAEQTKRIMQKLLPALKKQDIAEKDTQTNGMTVNSVYNHQDTKAKKEKLFEAASTVTIKIRNTAALSKIIDTALANGATGLSDVTWTHSDPEGLYTEARKQAIEKARAKIETYAQAAGLKLGRIINIEELSNEQNSPRLYMMRSPMLGAAAAEADMPVAEGEESYEVRISLTAELLPN